MRITAVLGLIGLGFALSGCATVFDGTSQEITVITNPPGASCVFERQGVAIGTIAATPGSLNVRKRKYDILVKCNKPGYQEAQYLNHSGTTATIAANVAADLILTAGLSSIVDSADGADNKYDSDVNISMVPAGMSLPASATPAPETPAPASAPPAPTAPAATPVKSS